MALALIVCGAVPLIPALVTLLQAGVSALHHRGAIWVADRRRRDVADWEYLGSDRRDAVEGRRSGSEQDHYPSPTRRVGRKAAGENELIRAARSLSKKRNRPDQNLHER